MNEHETHEAVVKLARRELEDHERINCWFRPEFVRALIDRLEAAHKREIEATAAKCCQLGRLAGYGASEIQHQQEPVGNAAKLREVCEKMLDLLTAEGFEDGGMSIELDEKQVIMWRNRFRAALSAAPRNCDKYANHNDAMKAFDAFVREQGKLGFINLYTESFKWLFATATEKEGGVK